jgi:hypothetical protein
MDDVIEKIPVTLLSETEPEAPAERPARRPEPVAPAAPPAAPPEERAPRNGKWWVEESDTTVGGPSFLGLSNSEESSSARGSQGYSYLFQDEPPKSHKSAWVLLALLVVLGGLVYAKWKPIRDYVLTTALSHMHQQQASPAAQPSSQTPASNSQPAMPASSAPTTTVATSDPQSPPSITTDTNQNTGQAANANPQQDKTAASGAHQPEQKPESKAATPPAAPPTADKGSKPGKAQAAEPAADETADADTSDEAAPPARNEKRAAARAARPAPASDGSELVTSGEKYLYGRGVPRSCEQAVTYFHAAAAKQNPQAFSHLGAMYATGECVPMDRAAAYSWFRRAYDKEPSNHYFEQNLTMLWREMSPGERQRAIGRQ